MSDTIPARGAAAPGRQAHTALIALIGGGIFISISPVLVRLSDIGPVATGFWRLALAVLPLMLLSRGAPPAGTENPRSLRDFLYVSLPGVLLATEMTLWHISLHLTSVANATLLVNMAPIFVTLYFWLFLRRRPGASFLVALLVTLAGVVILKGGPLALGGGDVAGDAFAILAAIGYASYLVVLARVRERFATGAIMVWGTMAGALCILPFAWISEASLLPATLFGWTVLFALAWLSHAGGQGLITYALAWLPATFSSLALLLQPVLAALLAWLLLAEALTAWQCLGGLIVLAGIWLAHQSQRRRPKSNS